MLYSAFLEKDVDRLIENYVEAEYQSEGAAIRVAMNALPAIVFLAEAKPLRARADRNEKLWTYMSLISLGAVAALVLTPSSTAVDRLALYGIPIQLFVWSRLPDVIGRGRSAIIVFGCVIYSSVVLMTWLLFATHSRSGYPISSIRSAQIPLTSTICASRSLCRSAVMRECDKRLRDHCSANAGAGDGAGR